MSRKRDKPHSRLLLSPVALKRDIVGIVRTPETVIYYRTRASWAALGKVPKPDAEGWMVPFIPTSVENLHVKSMKWYSDKEIENRSDARPPIAPPRKPTKERTLSELEKVFGKIVGPIPPIKQVPEKRGRSWSKYRHYPRKKRNVQIIDSDHNRDIGYTHDGLDQHGRTDLAGFDAADINADDSTNVIRVYKFGPEGPIEGDGRDDIALFIPDEDKDARSYEGRTCLLVPTGVSLTGHDKRLFKVLDYMKRNYTARRIIGLMKLKEKEFKGLVAELKKAGVLKDPDLSRDEMGRFRK